MKASISYQHVWFEAPWDEKTLGFVTPFQVPMVKLLESASEDQSAGSSICFVVTPKLAVLVQAAHLTEYDFKMLTSIPASFMVCLSHLTIEEEVTGLCSPIHEKNKRVSGLEDCKSLNSLVHTPSVS